LFSLVKTRRTQSQGVINLHVMRDFFNSNPPFSRYSWESITPPVWLGKYPPPFVAREQAQPVLEIIRHCNVTETETVFCINMQFSYRYEHF